MEHGSVGAAGPEELLRLSAEVAGLDADVADRLAQDRLRAVTDALAHALVDLADVMRLDDTGAALQRMLVPVAVFLGLQRFFVRGLTAGAVKG